MSHPSRPTPGSATRPQTRPWPSDPRYLATEHGHVIGPSGRVLAASSSHGGYPTIGWYQPGTGRLTVHVHRIVCESWHGPRPTPEHQVAHGNGVPDDNRPSNLRWATRGENAADALRHRTTARGGRHGRAQLTEAQVRLIRDSRGRLSHAELARMFGVSRATIQHAQSGRTWSHVT